MITPIATIITPTTGEYSTGDKPVGSISRESCFKNKENFTITKPNPIKAILVRIQARKVRSLARCSLDLSIEFLSSMFTIIISV